ncbi:unnamed protein product [Phytophthora fragariaefolia]|uniref:Unnamed protein product n=1 Tax=Phytophthora fragariaefolia TaxID=1490495 RepID=A0A9W7D7P6_9STRA|nr:unnamed protein product [Phytophthora fragariaefolia]
MGKLTCVTFASTDQKLQEVVDRIFPEFKEQEVILEKAFYANNNFKLKEEGSAGKDGEPTDGANGTSSSPLASSRARSKATTPTKTSHSVKPVSNGGILPCNRQFTIEVYPQETYVS